MSFLVLFLNQLRSPLPIDYESMTWLNVFKYRESRHEEYLVPLIFQDLKVYNTINKSYPNSYLQLSNSTSVRYTFNLFNLNTSIPRSFVIEYKWY